MRLLDYAFFLAVLTALAVWTVREESRSLRLGYELAELAKARNELRREQAELLYERARLASPGRLEQMAVRYGLELREPGLDPDAPPATRGRRAPLPRRQSGWAVAESEGGR